MSALALSGHHVLRHTCPLLSQAGIATRADLGPEPIAPDANAGFAEAPRMHGGPGKEAALGNVNDVTVLEPDTSRSEPFMSYLVARGSRISRLLTNMAVLATMMVAAAALIYLASMLQYRGYDWADATCAFVPDGCASPHYLAIATIAVIAIFFVMQAIKKAK